VAIEDRKLFIELCQKKLYMNNSFTIGMFKIPLSDADSKKTKHRNFKINLLIFRILVESAKEGILENLVKLLIFKQLSI